jgi:hypothetical protein
MRPVVVDAVLSPNDIVAQMGQLRGETQSDQDQKEACDDEESLLHGLKFRKHGNL